MKQSKLMLWLDTCGGTILGFIVALVLQYGICWWYGLPLTTFDNLSIIAIFTIASLIRGYGWRRFMELFHARRPLSPFMQAVIEECHQQVEREGYDIAHDDAHDPGELACAGAAYLYAGSLTDEIQRKNLSQAYHPDGRGSETIRYLWPWDWEFWKPKTDDRRRDLIRGCALGIAEGNKFDRSRKSKRSNVFPLSSRAHNKIHG